MTILLKGLVTVIVTIALNKNIYANVDSVNLEIALEPKSISFEDGEVVKINENYKLLFVDGTIIKDHNIVMDNKVTYIPARVLANIYDLTVEWNEEEQSVRFNNKQNLKFKVGTNFASDDKKIMQMDVKTIKQNGIVYVPLRFVFNYFGATITYYDKNNKNNIGIIKTNNNIIIDKKTLEVQKIATIEEALTKVRASLNEIFDTFLKDQNIIFNNAKQEEQQMLLNQIKTDLGNMYYQGEVSRFYIFESKNTIIFDVYTGDMYFELIKENNSYIYKLTNENSELFMSSYFAG